MQEFFKPKQDGKEPTMSELFAALNAWSKHVDDRDAEHEMAMQRINERVETVTAAANANRAKIEKVERSVERHANRLATLSK